jgi:fructose-bisphosphate aldolase class I
MNQKFGFKLPWPLSFSFGRALQDPALEIWGGENIYVDAAQKALLFRAQRNWLANRGEYSAVEDIKHDLESNVTVSK